MAQLDLYDGASPIQIINGLVTTERSGVGKWGKQSMDGLIEYCLWLKSVMPSHSVMVEIGSYAGESTIAFSMVMGQVHAIDPWVNGYDDDDLSSHAVSMEIVQQSFTERIIEHPNVMMYKMTGEEAAVAFEDKSLDFAYIDSIHKIGPCRTEILRWLPKIKSGGYIGGHDFCGYWGEVVDAVLESVGLPDIRFKDGSWAKKVL